MQSNARTDSVRLAIVNDYEMVVVGTAGVLAPFADRVTVVELDSRTSLLSDVDVVLYDTYGYVQGDSVDMDTLIASGTARLIVFSWNADPDFVRQALDRGASGYVSKAVTGVELVDAIERVHRGEVVTPAGLDIENDRLGRWPGQDEGLSPRESEILALICRGLSNQDITEQAFIGMNTVKTHIRSVYRKIDVTTRAQAVLWAVQHGFQPDRVRHVRR